MTQELDKLKDIRIRLESVAQRLTQIETDPHLSPEEKFDKMTATLKDLEMIPMFIDEGRLHG